MDDLTGGLPYCENRADDQSPWFARREILALLSAFPLFGTGACRPGPGPNGPGQTPVELRPLVDAHCHLFNITDLPAASFTRTVLLKDYAHRGPLEWWEKVLAKALKDIESILQRGVIRAGDEAASEKSALLQSAPALAASEEMQLAKAQQEAERALTSAGKSALAKGCERPGSVSPSPASIVRWLRNLRSSRTQLTRQLARDNAASGYRSELLCPALVDYCNWLDQKLASPLDDQMRAAARLSSNPDLPAVHGYMAFDPLRSALVEAGKTVIGGDWNPLVLLRAALVEHGFLGVKVYPTMGFRASGNAGSSQSYPPRVEDAFGGAAIVGKALDGALDKLWALCVELDAPVMAHAANSNAAGLNYGRRADPAFWLPVVEKHPDLRVLLGHFGRFGTLTDGQMCKGGLAFEQTWEAVIGRFVHAHPDCRLYADISFLSEIFKTEDREKSKQGMREYLKLDQGGRHLVYGSDWVMLGIEKDYPGHGGYPRRVGEFLQQCGLGSAAIEDIMRNNALRCLGLDGSTRARCRIEEFLKRHGLPLSRLPA